MINSFNKWIEMIRSAGLIDIWYYEKIITKSNIKKEQTIKPKRIKIQTFEGIFEIWVAGMFVSFLVFIVEIYVTRRTNGTVLKTTKEFQDGQLQE